MFEKSSEIMGLATDLTTESKDINDDSQNIASLDIGEAIVTSNFTKFAIPIKIPKFEDLIEATKSKEISRIKRKSN